MTAAQGTRSCDLDERMALIEQVLLPAYATARGSRHRA